MKKLILASVVAAGTLVTVNAEAATAICAAPTSAGNAANNPGTTSSDFVRNAFTPKCSANVHMTADSAQTYFRVGSGSAKGGRSFRGSSAGGSVASESACATGCVATDASAAATSTNNPTSG